MYYTNADIFCQAFFYYIMWTLYNAGDNVMKLRVIEILKEKGKTKYWLNKQLGLSFQNFNNMVYNRTQSIKFEILESLCDILECTPNDLFEEYHKK